MRNRMSLLSSKDRASIHRACNHRACKYGRRAALPFAVARFISLPQALADSAYNTPDTYYQGDGISWLDRWQLAFGKPVNTKQPEPPKWVEEQYDAISTPAKK
jgi:hypothetical protein